MHDYQDPEDLTPEQEQDYHYTSPEVQANARTIIGVIIALVISALLRSLI